VLSESDHVENVDDTVAAQVTVKGSSQAVLAEKEPLHSGEVCNIAITVVVDIAPDRSADSGRAACYLGICEGALVYLQVVYLAFEAGVVP